MLTFSETLIDKIAIHKVGDRNNEEGVLASEGELNVNGEIKEILGAYFLSSFKGGGFYQFYHAQELENNTVYSCVKIIFEDPEQLHEQSRILAKYLYETSNHPSIQGGDFYTVYFQDCMYNNEPVDAIGLFKSETRQTYLKVYPGANGYTVEAEQGIDIRKLDKGCLILNMEKEKGFIVSSVDKTSKAEEARSWMDDFLRVKQREDEYFQTENVIKMYKDFVVKELPNEYQLTKADQADMINKSKKFFKEADNFQLEDFTEKVLETPELIDSFNNFKKSYESENDIQISNEFDISESAVKKQSRVFKSVIKLDKNFHIYVHGNRDYIVKGFDQQTGLQFYQVYFNEEK